LDIGVLGYIGVL